MTIKQQKRNESFLLTRKFLKHINFDYKLKVDKRVNP